jgi:hypothetical protein
MHPSDDETRKLNPAATIEGKIVAIHAYSSFLTSQNDKHRSTQYILFIQIKKVLKKICRRGNIIAILLSHRLNSQ